MRRFLYLFLFIFIMCAMAVPVNAQTDITIDEMQVKIWPEYDQPVITSYSIHYTKLYDFHRTAPLTDTEKSS